MKNIGNVLFNAVFYSSFMYNLCVSLQENSDCLVFFSRIKFDTAGHCFDTVSSLTRLMAESGRVRREEREEMERRKREG